MQLLNRFRAWRVAQIEAEVRRINAALEPLDWEDLDGRRPLEAHRRVLWLKRTQIVRKLPPDYNEETNTP